MVSTTMTVLIVEPIPDQQWKLARMFTVGGFRVIGTSSIGAAQALLLSCPVDMILLSPEACSGGPVAAAQRLRVHAPGARLLVMEAGHPSVTPRRSGGRRHQATTPSFVPPPRPTTPQPTNDSALGQVPLNAGPSQDTADVRDGDTAASSPICDNDGSTRFLEFVRRPARAADVSALTMG